MVTRPDGLNEGDTATAVSGSPSAVMAAATSDLQVRAVLPPSFCRWQALGGVGVVSLLAMALVLLGRWNSVTWMQALTLFCYGLSVGLFCALSVCLCGALVRRLSVRGAWALAWLIVVISALAYSYSVGIVATVLGFGPGADDHAKFVLQTVLGAGMVSVFMFRYLFVWAQWEAETQSEAEARVQALQARIRPHFLFNSLNTIASLIHDNPESAERATEDLSELFRAGMRRADEMIALEDELDLARKYLDMEQRRLGERLQLDWSSDELPGSLSVLPMVLQPLLENAVNHGVAPLPEGGKVQVYGRSEGGQVVITITNPLARGHDQRGSGMALNNIRARLALAHGQRASLITSKDNERFYAVLTLPHG